MLESILVAATRVFAQKGYEASTMTEIAEAAGVAIGSLYQYVPTKDELAQRVMSRKSGEIAAYLDARLLALSSLPPAEAVPRAVRMVIEGHRMHARLPNLPFHQVDGEGTLSGLRDLERRVSIGLRVYLEAHRSEIGPKDLDLLAVLLIHMTDAAVHAAMARDPAWLESDALATELTKLWLAYLVQSG